MFYIHVGETKQNQDQYSCNKQFTTKPPELNKSSVRLFALNDNIFSHHSALAVVLKILYLMEEVKWLSGIAADCQHCHASYQGSVPGSASGRKSRRVTVLCEGKQLGQLGLTGCDEASSAIEGVSSTTAVPGVSKWRFSSEVGYRNWPRYGLRWSGWYCRPAQRVLCRIAVPTTTAQTV